jgi:hypothetical protein
MEFIYDTPHRPSVVRDDLLATLAANSMSGRGKKWIPRRKRRRTKPIKKWRNLRNTRRATDARNNIFRTCEGSTYKIANAAETRATRTIIEYRGSLEGFLRDDGDRTPVTLRGPSFIGALLCNDTDPTGGEGNFPFAAAIRVRPVPTRELAAALYRATAQLSEISLD